MDDKEKHVHALAIDFSNDTNRAKSVASIFHHMSMMYDEAGLSNKLFLSESFLATVTILLVEFGCDSKEHTKSLLKEMIDSIVEIHFCLIEKHKDE